MEHPGATRRSGALVRLRDITARYSTSSGQIDALRALTLDIQTEFLGVVGPSGCGKSTLLRLLAGLLCPSEGTIEFSSDHHLSYGIVFQDYSLLPWLTVQGNIELALTLRGDSPIAKREISHRLLERLGLRDFAQMLPHQLSGGMRQRVAVGRAFAPAPSLLLMDEPFGALDAVTREDLQESLTGLYESEPRTVVFVTHDAEEALFLSDRICLLTGRPGTIRRVVEVPFPRPRSNEIKRDQVFVNLKYKLEDSLRNKDTDNS